MFTTILHLQKIFYSSVLADFGEGGCESGGLDSNSVLGHKSVEELLSSVHEDNAVNFRDIPELLEIRDRFHCEKNQLTKNVKNFVTSSISSILQEGLLIANKENFNSFKNLLYSKGKTGSAVNMGSYDSIVGPEQRESGNDKFYVQFHNNELITLLPEEKKENDIQSQLEEGYLVSNIGDYHKLVMYLSRKGEDNLISTMDEYSDIVGDEQQVNGNVDFYIQLSDNELVYKLPDQMNAEKFRMYSEKLLNEGYWVNNEKDYEELRYLLSKIDPGRMVSEMESYGSIVTESQRNNGDSIFIVNQHKNGELEYSLPNENTLYNDQLKQLVFTYLESSGDYKQS